MSNYNTTLQSNNTDLQQLIQKANSLPDKVNIDEELNTQDSLISQIQSALVGKGAGNGGNEVKTCTVTIDSVMPLMRLCVTTFNQGNFDVFYVMNSHNANQKFFTIENVVCGSPIYLQLTNSVNIVTTLTYILSDSGSSYGFLYKAPLEKNVNSIIHIYDSGGN